MKVKVYQLEQTIQIYPFNGLAYLIEIFDLDTNGI